MVSLPVLPLCDPRAPQTLFHYLVTTCCLVVGQKEVILRRDHFPERFVVGRLLWYLGGLFRSRHRYMEVSSGTLNSFN